MQACARYTRVWVMHSRRRILFTQRDFIYAKHLGLPLDF